MPTAIILHGGAGSGKFGKEDPRFREIENALEEGRRALRSGSSVDAAQRAVWYMEESGLFNCGRGACLNSEGKVELDAAVMTGDKGRGAGVGVVTGTYHPVSLARWVSENTKHVLIAGRETDRYLRAARMEVVRARPSKRSMEKFRKLHAEMRKRVDTEGNTVGAVAVDNDGVPAAAVSTGGVWMKLPGRVGDSAVLGAGVFANKSGGAACATGIGEVIIRAGLSRFACDSMSRQGAQSAADAAIDRLTVEGGRGTGGIVTVDVKGRVGAAFNTEAMARAWYDKSKGKTVVRVS